MVAEQAIHSAPSLLKRSGTSTLKTTGELSCGRERSKPHLSLVLLRIDRVLVSYGEIRNCTRSHSASMEKFRLRKRRDYWKVSAKTKIGGGVKERAGGGVEGTYSGTTG